MQRPSVYRDTLKNIKQIRKRYKKIVRQKSVNEKELDFFENYYLVSGLINGLKNDLRACREELYSLDGLYSRLSARAEKRGTLDEKDVCEAVLAVGADYRTAFSAELIVKAVIVGQLARAEQSAQGVKNLRGLFEIDFASLFRLCGEEQILAQNEDFTVSDEDTKGLYRQKAYRLAKKNKMPCLEYLEQINTGKNMGEKLFVKRKNGWITVAAELFLTLLVCACTAYFINTGTAVLLFLPVWQICSALVVRISMRFFKTEALPRIKHDFLTEENSRTVIAVSMLITSEKSLCDMAENLQKTYFSCCNNRVSLCILADLRGGGDEKLEDDEKILCGAQKALSSINEKCGGNVTLCVRPRVYSNTQSEYMGRERKRGAIEDLALALLGRAEPFSHIFGAELPKGVQYILTLDSDTDLTMDCADELLQTALHPLNREKYGVITMRTEVDVQCSDATAFTRLMAGDGGITAYHSSAAERYQDIFGRGIFSGKGLIRLSDFYSLCCERFTEETVLSHDILEGELMGTAYDSRCQALDLFPTGQTSYLKRLHRWVRGDWQNSVFIFSRRPFKDRGMKNSLSMLSRFKLLDNLRRSITPMAAFLCIAGSAFVDGGVSAVLLAAGILSVTAGDVLSLTDTAVNMGRGGFSRRFYSGNLPHGVYPAVHAFFSLCMLPAEAFTALDGAVRGLYRRLVSKKNMLSWTTAQQGERSAAATDLIFLLPNILSALMLAFSPNAFGKAAAVIFLADIPFALLSGKCRKSSGEKTDWLTREELIEDARRMWSYYAGLATAENNFLPPDNVQQAPVYRVARRTSPTNIGMMAASALAALDLGIITADELCDFLEKTVSTVERMKKWRGNLYNWYDCVSCEPIPPYFISTVDSGNFLCAMTALRAGLEEAGGERAGRLAKRIGTILMNTELAPFYNKKNGLMHIGYDTESGAMSDSYYDLLMSEARMTSYYAVATRQAPRRHWESLGRRLARYKGYSGPVSWTGTMFEFFMPNIFLPSYKNTLEYEGLRFCMLCQLSYGRENGIPFGISESGYYDFDAEMNYRYKANGVERLGLKQNIPRELTVSPYSTYLTLPFERRASLKNLKALKALGAYGQYGLYEAVDFTPSRSSGQDRMLVKSFMAHHIGMSILSIDNFLNDNIMQRRFMSDSSQMAAESLLRERIPNRPFTVAERRKKQSLRGVKIRYSPVKLTENIKSGGVSAAYTNGEYTLVCCDNGASQSLIGDKTVTGITENPHIGEQGVYSAVFFNGKSHAFTAHSDFEQSTSCSAAICERRVRYFSDSDLGVGEQETVIGAAENCEVRSFSFKPRVSGSGYAAVFLRPVLCSAASYLTHRAFAKLFVLSEYDREAGCVIFKYTFRNGEKPLYCCVGTDSKDSVINLSAEEVLCRGKDNVFVNFHGMGENFTGIPDTCAAFKIPLTLKKGVKFKLRLVISAAESREKALAAYKTGFGELKGAKSLYSISGQSRETYFNMVSAAIMKTEPGEAQMSALAAADSRLDHLWRRGISGDFPIAVFYADGKNLSTARDAADIAASMHRAGIKCELCVICREKNQYDSSVKKALYSDSPAVHIIDAAKLSGEDENALLSFCRWSSRQGAVKPADEAADFDGAEPRSCEANGLYSVPPDTHLPWSWILADREFGTLLSNNSLGYTYYKNSQENKITPWINDTREKSGERLVLTVNGKAVDIIDNSVMTLFPDRAVYKSKVKLNNFTGESTVKECCFTVRVRVSGNKKVIEAEFANVPRGAKLAFLFTPVLGDRERHPQFITAEKIGDRIVFYNRLRGDGIKYYTECRGGRAIYSTEQLSGEEDGVFRPTANPIIGTAVPVEGSGRVKFVLGVENGDERTAEIPNKIIIRTPFKELDRMYNDFLPVQIIRGRVLARVSFYQCSGAYGFRDQLQDVISVVQLCPELAREVILTCAAAQFGEGDVLHWFHKNKDGVLRGVRTLYSDDLLWLIWAVHEYCEVTGDNDILGEAVPFLGGEELSDGETERYGEYIPSEETAELLSHCQRAFSRACRFGRHSLVLMGGGDWNDGFNKVGAEGSGESVFSTQLAVICGEKLSELYLKSGDSHAAREIAKTVESMRNALETAAFAGDRYLRAFKDSGEPLGTEGLSACAIDSITQSFAVFSGLDRSRCETALGTAVNRLVDDENRVIRLFAPSFREKDEAIGYITAYPAGIRENGGQYTHAAVWLARAALMLGRHGTGLKLLEMLNPLIKYRDGFGDKYKTEPYFLTGDVYYRDGLKGRGGWSLYTGSAAWYYKTVTDCLLGLGLKGDRLYFNPRVAELFPFEIKLCLGGGEIYLSAENPEGRLYCDGKKADFIPLDGENHRGKYK